VREAEGPVLVLPRGVEAPLEDLFETTAGAQAVR
jgi:hypothetical protein